MVTLRYMTGPSDELDLKNIIGAAVTVYPAITPDAGRRPRNEKAGESFTVTDEQWQALQSNRHLQGHQFEVVDTKAEKKGSEK